MVYCVSAHLRDGVLCECTPERWLSVQQLPSMVCPAVQVDEVFHLGPDAFDMASADGSDDVTITPPCAHTGPAPVQVRLISYQLREGQVCMLGRCILLATSSNPRIGLNLIVNFRALVPCAF